MESIEILKIRLRGIMKSIKGYSDNPAIIEVCDSLSKALLENNYEIILFACKEIDKWYQINISKILSNIYADYYDTHRANTSIIKDIVNLLEENEEYYKKQFDFLRCSYEQIFLTDSILDNLLDRFHQIVMQLRNRYDDRETLDVADEYDVQDLLHALLKIYCDDIRTEEWTPSYAGTSSRQDFLLKKEKVVIETKKTRKGLNNKELANELIVDIARYSEHPDCKKLVCFVYDPESRIKNPRGFESDLTKTSGKINVKVYIRP